MAPDISKENHLFFLSLATQYVLFIMERLVRALPMSTQRAFFFFFFWRKKQNNNWISGAMVSSLAVNYYHSLDKFSTRQFNGIFIIFSENRA